MGITPFKNVFLQITTRWRQNLREIQRDHVATCTTWPRVLYVWKFPFFLWFFFFIHWVYIYIYIYYISVCITIIMAQQKHDITFITNNLKPCRTFIDFQDPILAVLKNALQSLQLPMLHLTINLYVCPPRMSF